MSSQATVQANFRGFIRNRALGILTWCEDDFASWFRHLEERFSLYKKVQSKKVFAACENQCPPC